MSLIAALTLSVFFLIVLIIDLRTYTIPNWLNGLLILLYPVWVLLAPIEVDWLSGLLMGGVLFVAGFTLFALRMMGGGDTKLLTACGLFVGWGEAGLALVLYTAIFGGVMTLGVLALRYALPPLFTALKVKKVPRALTIGEPMVPYGPAISLAMLLILWSGRLPGMVAGELNIVGF